MTDMGILDLFGHFGYAMLFFGTNAVAKKRPYGWVFRATGETVWIVIGLLLGMSSIWAWGVLFLVNDVWGFFRWQE